MKTANLKLGSLFLLIAGAIAMTGCGQGTPSFSSNRIYLRLRENETESLKQIQIDDVATAVEALFGTPDEPYFVNDANLNVTEVLDISNLSAASGPITKDNYGKGQGLYRQHCVHCHGITGDGRGPTAKFLNPYPRDFRRGTFKFKSTPIGTRPTTEDLHRVVRQGIAGTAMPSFEATLKEGELEAIVDYVKYLAIRGEAERALFDHQCLFADYDPDPDAEEDEDALTPTEEFLDTELLVNEKLAEVLDGWRSPAATDVPERPAMYDRWSDEFDELELGNSITRGKELYYGAGQCFTCHGPTQLGDGQQTDYDQWTKEFYDWVKPKNDEWYEMLRVYESLGGLPIRNAIPRNLRNGVYRGGRRPVDIFWRVRNGIDGTPMPAASPSLVDDDAVWDIVNYVISIPYQELSRQGDETAYSRERQ